MDRAGALALAPGRAAPLHQIVRFDHAHNPLAEDQALAYLVHDDGLMRVPVLVWDDLLVRGYTEELYREALDGGSLAGERS